MREWNYGADKLVSTVRVNFYWTILDPEGHEVTGPVPVSASDLRALRESRADLVANGYTLRVERVVGTWEAKACYYCQARPRAWDHDCDGMYEMSTCEEPQCNAGYEWALANGYACYPFSAL